MKQTSLIFILLATALIACQSKTDDPKKEAAVDKPVPDEKPVAAHNHIIHSVAAAGCEANSWSPEVYTFYGDAETINKKLSDADMDLGNRRMYLVAIESGDKSVVKVYEKSKDGNVKVEQWEGKSAADFTSQASATILSNKGVNCVGEQTQALVTKLGPKDLGDVPAPVSAQAAFSHDIKNIGSSYLKVSIFLLC